MFRNTKVGNSAINQKSTVQQRQLNALCRGTDTISNLGRVATMLRESAAVATAPDSSKTKKKEAMAVHNRASNTFDGLLKDISNDLSVASGIPNMRPALEQRQTAKKREDAEQLAGHSSIAILKKIEKEQKQNHGDPPPLKKTDRKNTPVAMAMRSRKLPTPPVALPELIVGRQDYTIMQIVPLMVDQCIEKGSRKELYDYLQTHKLMPDDISRKRVDNLIRLYRKNPAHFLSSRTTWHQHQHTGRPPEIDSTSLLASMHEITDVGGRAFTKEDLKNVLVENRKSTMHQKGIAVLGDTATCTPSSTTIDKYWATVNLMSADGSENGLVPRGATVRKKTETREVAETSIRAVVCYIAMVMATHFIPVAERDAAFESNVSKLDKLGQWAIGLVREYYGNQPISCISPANVFSSDDSSCFVIQREKPKELQADTVIASANTLQNEKYKSVYQVGTDDQFSSGSAKIKVSHTFCLAGYAAPTFISVCGLNERELSPETCPDGILVVAVEGFAPGSNTMMDDGRQGFICFMREGAKDCDIKRYKAYQKLVKIPFMNKCRQDQHAWDGRNESLTPEMTIIGYLDGDVPQIKMITADTSPYDNKNIVVNRHNPGRTGVEQAADRCPIFRTINKCFQQPKPAPSVGTKSVRQRLEQAFKANYPTLSLDSRKKKPLMDCLEDVPAIFAKAMTSTAIQAGGQLNGLLDSSTGMIPCVSKMLGTCSRPIRIDELDLVKETLGELIKEHIEHGHIEEKVLDRLGYPLDTNAMGEVRERTASMTQEWCQRAKTLNHAHQVNLREKHLADIQEGIKKAKQKKDAVRKLLLEQNQKCEEQLLNFPPQPSEALQFVPRAAFDHKKTTCALLKAFLKARNIKINPKSQKKDLALLAFEKRNEPIRLVVQTDEPENAATDSPNNHLGGQGPNMNSQAILAIQMPSQLLDDSSWVNRVRMFIPGLQVEDETPVSDDDKKLTDRVLQEVNTRLQKHIKNRINATKQDHWCIVDFLKPNLPHMVAIMVLQGHIFSALKNLKSSDCLFGVLDSNFKQAMVDCRLHGAYLYYDDIRKEFVRSGKVAGRSFFARHQEHQNCARELTKLANPSLFYLSYPHSSAEFEGNTVQRGQFEDLKQLVAFGVSIDGYDKNLTCDIGEGGIFTISASVRENIKKCGFQRSQELTYEEKTMHMISYMAELVYELGLCPEKKCFREWRFQDPSWCARAVAVIPKGIYDTRPDDSCLHAINDLSRPNLFSPIALLLELSYDCFTSWNCPRLSKIERQLSGYLELG